MRQEYIEKRKQKIRMRRGDVYDWVESIVMALLLCVLVFTFLVRVVGVIGTSMINTLEEGDRLLVSDLFYTPRQGDIVVLRKESFSDDPIVKRIIATAGQIVTIDFETGTVSVNGLALDEPYVNMSSLPMKSLDFDAQIDKEAGGVVVPEGCVFVLGDNRNGSTDSRAASIGCVDERYIMGKALLLVFPGKDIDTGRRDWGRFGLLK